METQKPKLLLAEDDSSLGPLLQEYLEAKGYETKVTYSMRADGRHERRGSDHQHRPSAGQALQAKVPPAQCRLAR